MNTLEVAPLIFNRFFAPFLQNRDFIMFDQRGTGFSEPPLGCPEFTRLVYDTLDQDLSNQEEVALSISFLYCLRSSSMRGMAGSPRWPR